MLNLNTFSKDGLEKWGFLSGYSGCHSEQEGLGLWELNNSTGSTRSYAVCSSVCPGLWVLTLRS